MRNFGTLSVILCLMGGMVFGTARAGDITPELETLYLGKGQALVAYEPRTLTRNAHANSFLYSPIGDRIAYVSSTLSTDTANVPSMTISLNLVSTRTGNSTTYWQNTVSQAQYALLSTLLPAGANACEILGWSDDSAYLTFALTSVDRNAHGEIEPKLSYYHLDLVHQTILPIAAINLQSQLSSFATAPNDVKVPWNITTLGWIPGTELLSILVSSAAPGPKQWSLFLSHPADTEAKLCALGAPLPPLARVYPLGWLDNHRLLFRVVGPDMPPSKKEKLSYITDITTGGTIKAPEKLPTVIRSFEDEEDRTGLVSVPIPDVGNMGIGTEAQSILDAEKKPHGSGVSVWITRPKSQLGNRRLFVDVFPKDDLITSQPQFAPDSGSGYDGQYQIAYLSHGDIKVADLTMRTASLREKLIGGEQLPCPEERLMASSNAKQIGLGLLQYSQDYDEHYPPSDNFHDGVMPYLKDEEIFTAVYKYPFQYTPPSDLGLASVESPVDTVLGYFDLPCAKVVLYADGHVKAQNK